MAPPPLDASSSAAQRCAAGTTPHRFCKAEAVHCVHVLLYKPPVQRLGSVMVKCAAKWVTNVRHKTDPVCVWACMHVCLPACLFVWVCKCVYLCVQVCVYVDIYVYIWIIYCVCVGMWAGVCLWILNAWNKYNILQMYNVHYKLIYPGWLIIKQVMKKTKS